MKKINKSRNDKDKEISKKKIYFNVICMFKKKF